MPVWLAVLLCAATTYLGVVIGLYARAATVAALVEELQTARGAYAEMHYHFRQCEAGEPDRSVTEFPESL